MNRARILSGGRIESGPIRARKRNRVTIICDGRLLTGLPLPKRRKK
jgi:hypothetical protein